jgi:hypothetical protein
VLFALSPKNSIPVRAGQTVELWTEYRDPADTSTRVGGRATQKLVPHEHYAASSARKGRGVDLTRHLSVKLDAYAATAKWTVTNHGHTAAWVHTLKAIGSMYS